MADPISPADLLSHWINLADERLGAMALSGSDEFFAPMHRMLKSSEPEWRAGVYDDHGKWMDGWETRRRRNIGHDHCIVQLAAPCTLAALEIDTRYFTGNYPPHASVEACRVTGPPGEDAPWVELLPHAALKGNQRNVFGLHGTRIFTHLKLNIYPDGGVARLRAYGTVHRDWAAPESTPIDLAAALNGGQALACSDEHYGSKQNLLLPGRGASMADGWETRRRREPGYDWVILRLGNVGRIQKVEIDTAHFKGNFPHRVSLHGRLLEGVGNVDLTSQCLYWPELLEPQALQADHVRQFAAELRDIGPISHVRLNIHPDGGLSRVRLLGVPEARFRNRGVGY